MKNLIICHTPLQCLIAQHIIQQFPKQEFDLFMFGFTDTPKVQHYFKQTAALCSKSEFILFHYQRPLLYFSQLRQLTQRQQTYQNVFVASFDSWPVHALLSGTHYQHLFTFDDGTANILPQSFLYRTQKPSLPKRMIRYFCGIRVHQLQLRQQSEGHYTLYPEHSNITQPLIPVRLFQPTHTLPTSSHASIRILLGQPFLETEQENIHFFQNLIQQLNIDYYCPHPRESYRIDNIPYLQTDLIIEDYLLQHLRQHPNQTIYLYTLFSTAALNLLPIPNIHIEVIRTQHPFFSQAHIAQLYQIMEQSGLTIRDDIK